MSRQRLRESNIKWAIKLTNETLALKVIKLIEIKIFETNAKIVDVSINEKILKFIEIFFSEDLNYFKKKNKVKININIGENLGLQDYNIEFKSKSNKILEKIEKVENLQNIVVDNIEKNKEPKIEKNQILKEKNLKRKKF